MKPVSLVAVLGALALLIGCAQAVNDIGKGYVVTGEPPTNIAPAVVLSPQERRENFDFLCRAIDENYAQFGLKPINWDAIRQRYRARMPSAVTTDDFYRLLCRLVAELKDSHSFPENYRYSLPTNAPGLTVDLFKGRPFVVAVSSNSEAARLGVAVGSEVLEVDSLPVEQKMEQLRSQLDGFSSDRAFRRQACRQLLRGEKGSVVTLKLRVPEGESRVFALKRTFGAARPPTQADPLGMTRQHFVHFGRLPSGLGYIRIVSFLGRKEVEEEFDHALESIRETPGLVLDIRDNPGGFGHPYTVGRLIHQRIVGAISYRKAGPGHRDLRRNEDILKPTGPWQYRAPVALLVNDITGSAADLFACYLRSAKRVVTIGTTTHGNLSGVAAHAVLPCGLVFRISNGYVCDGTGNPIEGLGNPPDIVVSPTITDFMTGRDPVLEKAVSVLLQARPRGGG